MSRSYQSPTAATFCEGRKPELAIFTLALAPASRDDTQWILTETETTTDDKRPAILRVTTTRHGETTVALKIIDFRRRGDDVAKLQPVRFAARGEVIGGPTIRRRRLPPLSHSRERATRLWRAG